MYNRLLTAAEKDVNSAVEDFGKWRSGDEVARVVHTEDRIMENINAANTAKIHEEELYGKFLSLRERFIQNPSKLAES